MSSVGDILLGIFREAWQVLVILTLAIGMLAGLAQILRLSAGTMLGANLWVWEAMAGISGVLMLVLFAFLGIPVLVEATSSSIPGGAGCGPINDLGTFSAMLIAGLAGLRMLKATFLAVLAASAGGAINTSAALIEIAEAMFGMLLASVAVPVAAIFLGAC
ncbi:MAG: hypothetical protein H8E29_00375 [Anaerolineales bacterium]|uniref:Uncharacterized protein n=1 Tax=Candidatus Desulfolinea nitratireducens TaxID=2841698 RepID=A0A8J6NGJ6_9CHLR|nr:hypothetical protein [Candidatus Desulfolinea nitratireducens]